MARKKIREKKRELKTKHKQMIKEGKRAILTVDKLYIDGQLFKDKDITPWLY